MVTVLQGTAGWPMHRQLPGPEDALSGWESGLLAGTCAFLPRDYREAARARSLLLRLCFSDSVLLEGECPGLVEQLLG